MDRFHHIYKGYFHHVISCYIAIYESLELFFEKKSLYTFLTSTALPVVCRHIHISFHIAIIPDDSWLLPALRQGPSETSLLQDQNVTGSVHVSRLCM